MDTAPFELHLTLPIDARFVAMVRDMVALGACCSGCSDVKAAVFGRMVEDALRHVLAGAPSSGAVSIALHQTVGSMEVAITGERVSRTLTLEV